MKSWIMKLMVLGVLALVLLLALSQVRGLLNERAARAQEASAEVAQFNAGEQQIDGPYLVLPYQVVRQIPATKGVVAQVARVRKYAVLSPQQLRVVGKLQVEQRQRGIFPVQVYQGQLRLSGQFDLAALEQTALAEEGGGKPVLEWGTPYLTLGMENTRGIRSLTGRLGGQSLTAFSAGAQRDQGLPGVNVALPATLELGVQPFELTLELNGAKALSVAAIGQQSELQLTGNWAHPSFQGDFAPVSREVGNKDFSATWRTNQLATGGQTLQTGCVADTDRKCSSRANWLGVRLLDPVDRYVMTERSLKYGELFLMLIGATVLLCEILRRLRLHPVQYLLVGLALVLFFLLLLSLSEQIGFALAYLLASASSVLLLGYYASYLLRGWRVGLGFAALLSAMYGLLYGILQSEDMALLMGSLALFAMLAAVMVLTRKLDWNELLSVQARRGEA